MTTTLLSPNLISLDGYRRAIFLGTFCFLSYDIMADILLVFGIPFHQRQLIRHFHFRFKYFTLSKHLKRARNESWKQYRSQNKSLIHLTYRNCNTKTTRQKNKYKKKKKKKKKTRQSSNKTDYEHETRLMKCQEIQGKTNLWNCRPGDLRNLKKWLSYYNCL